MTIVSTPLGPIGYDSSGAGRTPILFLHGVGSDRSAWRPQLEAFGAERMALAMDFPGYGDSGFHPGATRETFADMALALLDALAIERVHLCGLSLGGVIALALHAKAPERLASLILADTFAVHPEGQAIYDRSIAAAAELGLEGLAKARVDALLAQPADVGVRGEVIATMARIAPEAYKLAAAAVWLADQRQVAAIITLPTLILCGGEDRITPPALSEELKDLIRHAALVEIAGAGHLSNLERPATFNRVLAAFLTGVEQDG